VDVFDKNMISDDLIGFSNIKFSSLMINAENGWQNDWHSLYYDNQRVGLISLSTKYEGEHRLVEFPVGIEMQL